MKTPTEVDDNSGNDAPLPEAGIEERASNAGPGKESDSGNEPAAQEPQESEKAANETKEPSPEKKKKKHGIRIKINTNAGSPGFFPTVDGDAKIFPDRPQDLAKLPPNTFPFKAPNHGELVKTLERNRVILLMSYKERAAWLAAYSLVNDHSFRSQKKLALFPTHQRGNESNLDFMTLTEKPFLEERPQILLVEIKQECALLGTVLNSLNGVAGRVCDRLESTDSYLVFSIDEDLVDEDQGSEWADDLASSSISHFRYLLTPHYDDRAATLEERLCSLLGLGPDSPAADRRKYYPRVAEQLRRGAAAFEAYLAALEEAAQPAAANHPQPQTVGPSSIFPRFSEVHRTAAFIGTYFPELNQNDFDLFVRTLLGNTTTTKETVRQAFRRDGKLVSVREKTEELWTDRWLRDADSVFRKCHLHTVPSESGALYIDFREPDLRDDLRSYLETRHPWYLRKQCALLQDPAVLFASDLSQKAVDDLIHLYVERAVIDPAGFGWPWLRNLILLGRAALTAVAQDWEDTFTSRVAALLREMLDRDVLCPVIRDLFDNLLTDGEHEALLDIIASLAPRFRFGPGVNLLTWMRRLLDEGSEPVRQLTREGLIALARRSGPRIYDVLEAIETWLPDSERPLERLSFSHRFALDFLFYYCAEVAAWMTSWPAPHPLFYSLPRDEAGARSRITLLVEWIVCPSGVALVRSDPSDPLKSTKDARMALVADLIEHWAWVLEGPTEKGPADGQAMFNIVLKELHSSLSAGDRASLQRAWQKRQEEQLSAAGASAQERRPFMTRRTKLENLRWRFKSLSTSPSSEGDLP
jgi:hypothetical protein